jgi:hypothetical protein
MARKEASMIELNEPLQQALAEQPGKPLRVVDPHTRETYVLVRADLYEQLVGLLDDSPVLATGELVDRIMAEDDANDPALESYQSITREGEE